MYYLSAPAPGNFLQCSLVIYSASRFSGFTRSIRWARLREKSPNDWSSTAVQTIHDNRIIIITPAISQISPCQDFFRRWILGKARPLRLIIYRGQLQSDNLQLSQDREVLWIFIHTGITGCSITAFCLGDCRNSGEEKIWRIARLQTFNTFCPYRV